VDLRAQLQQTLSGSYTIERELGGGGMSRVFVAEETRFHRRVVIKVLSPDLAAELSVERFQREIMLAAQLQQANIVPVLDAGAVDGLPWYSMPYVEGETLRARMVRGRMPADETARILGDVARALDHAHGHGVVHRDIKPENVLLSGGTAVVTDFGIAKALSASRTQTPGGMLTIVGTSVGTPAYMSPEQAAGDEVDTRADLYAWGVMAYEMLSGAHPYASRATAQQLLAAHVSERPAPLTGVPDSLAMLVMRTLEKDPSRRPQSAGELLAALHEATSGAHVRPPATHRWRVATAAALLLLGVLGAVVWRARSAQAKAPLVAVLPFESAGPVADSLFADGLGDAVTAKLSQLSGLRVIDRRSVLSVKDASRSAQATGKALGADYVLRATMRWARAADGSPRVQVRPTLVRVADGTTTWAGEPQLVSPADPFTVQATLATNVAEALDVALESRERAAIARRATADTAAFAAFTRGKRLADRNFILSLPVYREALREFERASRLDPRYADAIGGAAGALVMIAQLEPAPTLFDSAAALSRRALGIAADQADALATATTIAILREHTDEAIAAADRAVAANPSNARVLELRAAVLLFVGDSARAWSDVERYVALAPRSAEALINASDAAALVRRFDDAAELLRRAMTLEPNRLDFALRLATLARAKGDFTGMARALRDYRARGGRLGAQQLRLLRVGDEPMQRELANASPETYGAASSLDSSSYYSQKGQLLRARGDERAARALLDSGATLLERRASDPAQPALERRINLLNRAWFAAAVGDRGRALPALAEANRMPALARWPTGQIAASLSCVSAEVHGFLGDVDQMLVPLRRCLTLPGGYTASWILTEPARSRHATDPRVRALLGELRLQIGRKG
jgi:serine/threonine-protein kinase